MMAKVVQRVGRQGWWEARTVRERRLLLALAAVLTLFLLWLVVIRPLADAQAAAEARLTAAAADLGRARAEAASASPAAAPVNNNPVPLPVDGFLMQSGQEQGLTGLSVIADGAARARISIANVRPPALFGWIAQLEGRGLVVESLSARANADQTIAVEAVLRARNG